MTTPSRRSNKWKRPNVWLGKIIPPLLVVFGYYGYRLVLLDVYPLLRTYSTSLARIYISWVNTFLALVIWSYSLVYFHENKSRKGRSVPAEVQAKRVVFACDKDGLPLRCSQDDCDGSYLSIQTRHCRDCRTCQVGFDHHCAFMDNCVSTSSTFKPFVNFIFFAVLLLVVALVPLAPLQSRAFREVIATTWKTEKMRAGWWSRWYSWAGGPVWRYAGAIVIGYIHYPSISMDRPFLVPGYRVRTFVRDGVKYAYDEPHYPRLATPNLSTLAIVSFATLIVGIGVAMLMVIVLNSRKGVSAVQAERSRRFRLDKLKTSPTSSYDARIRLWIPLTARTEMDERESQGAIVLVDPDTPLYDFGPMKNWKRLMGERWWEWFIPTRISAHDDTEINPSILNHLRIEASKKQ